MLGYKVFVGTKQIYNLVTCTLSITNTRRYPTHCCGDCREFEIKLNGDDVDSFQLRGWKLVGWHGY